MALWMRGWLLPMALSAAFVATTSGATDLKKTVVARDLDPFDHAIRARAGAGAKVCGEIPVEGDADTEQCVAAALTGTRPFWARLQRMGIDSRIAHALVRDPEGLLWRLDYDSERCRRRPTCLIRAERCEAPKLVPGRSGTRVECRHATPSLRAHPSRVTELTRVTVRLENRSNEVLDLDPGWAAKDARLQRLDEETGEWVPALTWRYCITSGWPLFVRFPPGGSEVLNVQWEAAVQVGEDGKRMGRYTQGRQFPLIGRYRFHLRVSRYEWLSTDPDPPADDLYSNEFEVAGSLRRPTEGRR